MPWPSRSEIHKARSLPSCCQQDANRLRKFAAVPEYPLKDDNPLHITVEWVLRGIADTRQHLLTVADDLGGRASGYEFCHHAGEVGIGRITGPRMRARPGRFSGGPASADCDVDLGEPVTDCLKRSDLPSELSALSCVGERHSLRSFHESD